MARPDGMGRGPRRRWRRLVRLLNRDGTTFTRPTGWTGTYQYPEA